MLAHTDDITVLTGQCKKVTGDSNNNIGQTTSFFTIESECSCFERNFRSNIEIMVIIFGQGKTQIKI